MKLANQQQAALDAVNRWLKDPYDQVFELFGYAGTGKTTIATELASGLSSVLFGAFTGKAASVMRQCGCHGATTIHKLIYLPKSKSRMRLIQMEERLKRLIASEASRVEIIKLEKEIEEEQRNYKRPSFTLNLDSPVKEASLLVLDEVSQINEQMGQDLLSFGVKILALGDPAQLPPVRGTGFFNTSKPKVMLTEIHRQARDNPIIQLATQVRSRERLEEGQYGESTVMDWADLEPGIALNHRQLIVGRNKTRKGTNRRMRELLELQAGLPVPGDKLVCLKNNHDLGLLNGEQWNVEDCRDVDETSIMLKLFNKTGDDKLETLAHKAPFMGKEIPHWDHDKKIDEFDYGYAMTCHKAQGSQWDSVLVLDESNSFRPNHHKWLYTAITRAAQRVTIAR